jgi:hypothetical protein
MRTSGSRNTAITAGRLFNEVIVKAFQTRLLAGFLLLIPRFNEVHKARKAAEGCLRFLKSRFLIRIAQQNRIVRNLRKLRNYLVVIRRRVKILQFLRIQVFG